ncbi:MAG: phosphate/phosphite/phosphonate ABC transporter substrate-binding protein [Chloroflexota bacterium]
MDHPIRFQTFLAPSVRPVYQAIADRAGARLGRPAVLETGADFAAFARGEADFGFICGLPYVQLARSRPAPVIPLAAPVLRGERYAGRAVYFSDVIVRHDSPITTFAGLRGRSWAYNDLDSHSGYNLARSHLARLGETRGFFGAVIEAGFHQRAIHMVADGEVDAAAIDSQVLAIELRDRPGLAARLRVIDTLGPSTIQPLVAAAHVPAATRAAVRDVALSLAGDPSARALLDAACIDRFVPIHDEDYDDIRAMLAACEDAGFLTLA